MHANPKNFTPMRIDIMLLTPNRPCF